MAFECLLVSTNRVVTPFPVYPLGVAHLLGALAEAGYQSFHYDLLAEGGLGGLAEMIEFCKPGLIGLSIRNLDTVDSTAPEAFMEGVLETVAFIRRHSKVPLVLGGPAFSIMPEIIMDLLQADYGIVGEGEKLLPWLAAELSAGRKPSQKILRSKPAETIWHKVVYDQKIADHYLAWGGMLNIQTKRGCPYRCSYCSYPVLEGKAYRFREPQEVAAEVMRVGAEYGAKCIFFTDSVFNDRQGHYLEVAEALVRAGNQTPWCAYFRPQNLTAADLRLMKRAGLAAMELGTDGGCNTTLAGLQKDFTFDDVLRVNELAAEQDLACAHFLIFGGPDETRKTLAEGLANIEKLKNSVVFAFTGIRVLPGTAMHQRAIEDGVLSAEQSLLEPFFYFSPHIDEQEIDLTIRQAWRGKFDRIYPPAALQGRVTLMHSKGHVGPLWDMLISRRQKYDGVVNIT
ncbi:MAG: cobalamin-dependent protein [Proteobacteria bacterium]|nr:cobalamin-dependent protein [Pseudomonadota bacterium]MBU1716738.1 cobalamin-dependent protein [Pseudomonadota bacterium]